MADKWLRHPGATNIKATAASSFVNALGLSDFTITGFMSFVGGSDPGIVSGSNTTPSRAYYLEINTSGGYVAKFVIRDGAALIEILGNVALNDGERHLLGVTCDRSSATGLRLFVDGIEAADPVDITDFAAVDFEFDANQICRHDGAAAEGMHIDQVRIYKGVALSPEQMAAIWNNGIGAKVVENVIVSIPNLEEFWYCEFDEEADGYVTARYWSEASGWDSDAAVMLGEDMYLESGGVPFAGAGRHFCLLADVKTRLGVSVADYDDIIDQIIDGLDGIFDNYVGRHLLLTDSDVTEYYGLDIDVYRLMLKRYPVISITSIKEASDYDFDSATALVADTDYRLVNGGLNGIIMRINARWLRGEDVIQFVGRGGYCVAGETPSEGEYALPAEIRDVAILQAAFMFKRKDDVGLSSVSVQGGSISKFADIELLPHVRQVLDKYKIPPSF